MKRRIESVFLCFLEKGHTENSADEVHSVIENQTNTCIFSPIDWVILIRRINGNKLSSNVKMMKRSSFLDVKSYSNSFSNFHRMKMDLLYRIGNKVKIIMVRKEDLTFYFSRTVTTNVSFKRLTCFKAVGKERFLIKIQHSKFDEERIFKPYFYNC